MPKTDTEQNIVGVSQVDYTPEFDENGNELVFTLFNGVDECDPKPEDMVEIPREEYNRLMDVDTFMDCLNSAGVDNWDGYSVAHEMMENPDA